MDSQTREQRTIIAPRAITGKGAREARRKFLRFFPQGFDDPNYLEWERNYKWAAHEEWERLLKRDEYRTILLAEKFDELAARAVRIESRTHLLYSFEKMAIRDAVRSREAARSFSVGLYNWLYGSGEEKIKFERWCEVVAALPRKQSRVLTWPLVTVFGFIALPTRHIYLKPMVTREAARRYGFDFEYHSRPSRTGYASLLEFAAVVRRDLADLRPRDMIDIQSFLWVLGSDEYAE
jgi:hypothetical protein